MTIIQPNKEKNFFKTLLVVFAVPVLGGVLSLVVLYNRTVTMGHNLSEVAKELETLEAHNAELKESFFALFDRKKVEDFISERELIKEKNPQYLMTEPPWLFASQ